MPRREYRSPRLSRGRSAARRPASARAAGRRRRRPAAPGRRAPPRPAWPPRPDPRRAIVSRLDRSITLGSGGHGVSTTPATVRPAERAASRVSSVWLIVPRPGRAATTSGSPSSRARARTSASGPSGTSRPPTPSTTMISPTRAAPRTPSASHRSVARRFSGQLGGQMGGHRRPVAGQDHVGRVRPGGARQQLMVGRPVGIGRIVESGDERLDRPHRRAAAPQRRHDRGGDHGLAHPGVGAGDKAPAQVGAHEAAN